MADKRDFPITPNFRLSEFEVSQAQPELVEPVPDGCLPNVIKLAVTILQPLREKVGPLRILSGYRAPALNRAVGGSDGSQHMQGQAADITARQMETHILFTQIQRDAYDLKVGQVIYYPTENFVHVALQNAKYRTPTFFLSRAGTLTKVY